MSEVVDQSVEAGWGNPDDRTFAKREIRELRYEGIPLKVHQALVEIFWVLLQAVNDEYIAIPLGTIGWRLDADRLAAQGRSLMIPSIPHPRRLLQAAGQLGLVQQGYEFRFPGERDAAHEITRRLVERRVLAHDSIENALIEVNRPGSRMLGIGSTGRDVLFLQLLFQTGSSGVFDERLAAEIRTFQAARFLPETGEADRAFWLSLFPERSPQVAPGDGGWWVKMVQAALISQDYGADLQITAQYGTRVVHAVRWMQEANGLRVNGFVRGPEWGALVVRPVDGLPFS